MTGVAILGLLIYTCGAFGFGALLMLWWRDPGRLRKPRACLFEGDRRERTGAGATMLAVSFVWFVTNALSTLLRVGLRTSIFPLEMFQIWLMFLFPPIVMHLYYVEASGTLGRSPGPLWRAVLLPTYAATQAAAGWSILTFLGVLPGSRAFVSQALNVLIPGVFLIAVGYAVAIRLASASPRETPRERQLRRGNTTLWVAMAALLLLLAIFSVSFTRARPGMTVAVLFALADIGAKSMPLFFIFLNTYFDNRFKFFDVFVKRGLSLLLTIGTLTGACALLLFVFGAVSKSSVTPWVYAIALLPVVTAVPWLYSMIGDTLDRRWLGRRFTPVEAVKHFVSGLRSATSEAQLIERAEESLTEIFGARTCVHLGTTNPPAPFRVRQETPFQGTGGSSGMFLMGPRRSEAPYFSEDVALLASLADVFASVLDNLRLQEQKLEQDQRARELTLHASQSELKALRAQINPHFFFNALNAIAGLIHTDPAVADRTVEQLADVFRYALRGGESEWALLDDEIDFVRAYLDVERARFGSRLRVDVRLADDVRGARIPTMIVQTLVENAVKHGVAEVRGVATVGVDACRDGDRLRVSVTDNGPGLSKSLAQTSARPTKGGGYGLLNIQRRLDGYFGGAAALTIERDSGRGLTVAAVSMPFDRLARPLALDGVTQGAAS